MCPVRSVTYVSGRSSLIAKHLPFTRNRHLAFESFNGKRSERNLGDTVGSLRIRYPGHRILQLYLVLRHRSQFLVDSQPGLRNDSNDVPQILRSVGFNSLLLTLRSKSSENEDGEMLKGPERRRHLGLQSAAPLDGIFAHHRR